MRVVISDRAEAEINAAHAWWAENRSAAQADRWYDGILSAICRLELDGARRPLAHENDRFPFEVRQLNFGLGRRPSHRVLFTIRPDCVYVLAVVHVSQDAIGLDDI